MFFSVVVMPFMGESFFQKQAKNQQIKNHFPINNTAQNAYVETPQYYIEIFRFFFNATAVQYTAYNSCRTRIIAYL